MVPRRIQQPINLPNTIGYPLFLLFSLYLLTYWFYFVSYYVLFGPISYLLAVLVELIPFSCFYQAVLFATISADRCKLSPLVANGWQTCGFRWNGNRGYFPIYIEVKNLLSYTYIHQFIHFLTLKGRLSHVVSRGRSEYAVLGPKL